MTQYPYLPLRGDDVNVLLMFKRYNLTEKITFEISLL